jgi:formamidopyrimidine-DNA glycosylase
MPELPEVEIMTRNARAWMLGQPVADVLFSDALLNEGAAGSRNRLLASRMIGLPVSQVQRRGKVMFVDTAVAGFAVHFRMTGKWVLNESVRRTRFTVMLDSFSADRCSLVDTRRLGTVEFHDASGREAAIHRLGLGPEPWPEPLAWTEWRQRLSGKMSIKQQLLDGARISGLGNICASELLWRSGIHPITPGRDVRPAQWKKLAAVCAPWIDEVIREESAPEIGYVNESGVHPDAFAVYARDGQPCRRCGTAIERMVQGGRGTWLCPRCQPAPLLRRSPKVP